MQNTKLCAHESIVQRGQYIFLGVSTLILSSIYLNPTPTFRSRISRLWTTWIEERERAPPVRDTRTSRHWRRMGPSLSSTFHATTFTCKGVHHAALEQRNRNGLRKIRHVHHGMNNVHVDQHKNRGAQYAFEVRSVKEFVVKKKCSVTSMGMC
ncbi:hypothetical protein PMAYCL1PPCAC_09131 [Pristionchus mayeri]|uniref:Uncharacterized protein n=1 Tax=Pristionchus mayeri TaxID=1317129 RepID=A0AAN4ZH21_9BILA|nr:hypothetical protein PMAYCL1PPCAC_09131 [Pristionchus mayeri]